MFVFPVLLIREKDTNQSRGYGFVTFENPIDSEDAVKALDNKVRKYYSDQN